MTPSERLTQQLKDSIKAENNSTCRYVVGGTDGPRSGQIWANLEDAKTYKRLLSKNYPQATQTIYRLVPVEE